MTKLLNVLALLLLTASSLPAAPNRKPAGPSAAVEEDVLPALELTRLANEAGVRFGDWAIWRSAEGGDSYFLLNQKTGLGLYLYWGSNGWVNYRNGDGTWFVLFPTGAPSLQDRRELKLERFVGKLPTARLAPGNYKIQGWTITVNGDMMELHTPNVRSTINLRANSPIFTHNDRTIEK